MFLSEKNEWKKEDVKDSEKEVGWGKRKKNDDRQIWPFSVLHFESSIPDRAPRQSHFYFLPVFELYDEAKQTEYTLF